VSRRDDTPPAFAALAKTLDRELPWFCRVLDARLKLHFNQEAPAASVEAIPAPKLDTEGCAYTALVREHKLRARDRLVLMLALAPHLRPALLDPLFIRNSTYDRAFTEFGGLPTPQGGFLPSIETALFLVAGDDLAARLEAQRIFVNEHPLLRGGLLDPLAADATLPASQRALRPSTPFLHQLFQGEAWRPRFGQGFPARLITTQLEWKDLVLPHATRAYVDEIITWVNHGQTLLDNWDLGRHLKRGFRALFAGPPGTGKTLTASLLGRRTQRDVYRIDLAAVVSKYIGETEKNLEAVFAQAEDKNWILFFDEADALFGKRSQVRDAHDRYANQEVSYLLQRLEDFPGLVILATNMKDNLDEAFLRRFQAVIHFPMPGPDELHELWRQGFSARTPLAPEIDLRAISQRYRLSGGAIMNVVRHCSLRAVQREGHTILLPDIVEGIRREYHKEGRTI